MDTHTHIIHRRLIYNTRATVSSRGAAGEVVKKQYYIDRYRRVTFHVLHRTQATRR